MRELKRLKIIGWFMVFCKREWMEIIRVIRDCRVTGAVMSKGNGYGFVLQSITGEVCH